MSVSSKLKRDAFSLIELLIVVVVMGVVYSLAIGDFKKIEDGEVEVTLRNLKEHLNRYPHKRSVELLCLDDCSSCDILVDGKKLSQENSLDDFIDDSIAVYKYDFNLGLSEVKKRVYFNSQEVEEDVCFSFSVDKKGVGDQVLVEFKNSVYDFSTYYASTPVYNSIQEAIDEKEALMQEVQQ